MRELAVFAIVGALVLATFAMVLHVSHQTGVIKGHRQALRYLEDGDALPRFSPVRAIWEIYDSVAIIDRVVDEFAVLEDGSLVSIDRLRNPQNLPLEGAVIHRGIVHSPERYHSRNRHLLEKIKEKGH
jgi:hypothetical protein